MTDPSMDTLAVLDAPEVSRVLFHPRPERFGPLSSDPDRDVMIPVVEGAAVGGRFYIIGKPAPNILFFHGNGEIVADYADLAPFYNERGINFLPVDYRGYGRSTGSPTITAMMRDCHRIYEFTRTWLAQKGCTGRFIVMGRSLGSASALELASRYGQNIDGVIIESGFAYAAPLLRLLGVDVRAIGFTEAAGFGNIDKIRAYAGPTLIIHARMDHIIPFSDGKALYDASSSKTKRLLEIPGADHNTLLNIGFSAYMDAVKALAFVA